MARKPQQNNNEVVTDAKTNNDNFYRAGIFKVSDTGEIQDQEEGYFLLNPASIQDDKNTNWVKHTVPGSESPVLQWVSGGARTITIEALVTKDIGFSKPKDISGLLTEAASNVVGSIASKFAGVNIPPLGDALSLFGITQGEGTYLSIANDLEYYRSLLKPVYTAEGKLKSSPPLVVLYFGISLGNPPPVDKITANTPVFVVDDVKITINKFLPNLSPMEANVTLTLTQYNITGGVQGAGMAPDLSLSSILSIKPPF